MAGIKEAKEQLRDPAKNKIKEFLSRDVDIGAINRAIIDNLASVVKNPELTLGVYAPMGDEVDWESVAERFARRKIVYAYPKMVLGSKRFNYFTYTGTKKPSELGISLDDDEAGEKVTPDAVLIPALAYDSEGYRLGRGGGYYDSYLKKFSGPKIGIVYSCSIEDSLPREEHDVPVDYIITEKEIFYCKDKRSC